MWWWLGAGQPGILVSHGKSTGLKLRDLNSGYNLICLAVTLDEALIFSED